MLRVDQDAIEEAIHVVDGALEEFLEHDLEVLDGRKIKVGIT